MPFRFSQYSTEELSECGKVFANDFADLHFASDDTRDRTKAVLQWFCESTAPGLYCYGIRPYSEFLVDQCHATFQLPTKARCERWEQPGEIRLALECEWGKFYNGNETCLMILDDAWKLAMIRATVKVVIFATHKNDVQQETNRQRIVDSLSHLRIQGQDDAPWPCKESCVS